MFSTKALKLQTQKKIKNLTENQEKKKEENLKNLRRKNRLMTEIFNKVNEGDVVFIHFYKYFNLLSELAKKCAERKSKSFQHRQFDLKIIIIKI